MVTKPVCVRVVMVPVSRAPLAFGGFYSSSLCGVPVFARVQSLGQSSVFLIDLRRARPMVLRLLTLL